MEPILDWEQRYKNATTAWERDHLNPGFNEWRPQFSQSPGHVILPGCGRSAEVLAFAELGWQVTAIDLAETAITYQRDALQKAGFQGDVIESNMFLWQPQTPVDLVYEQTCLCALHPDQWVAYEQQIHRWLKPGGQLAALFMQTDGDGGPPFHCGIGAMQTLFSSTRWQWGVQSFTAEHPLGVHERGYLLTRL